MCPAEHSIPGKTTHNNRTMQRVELLVKLLYHLLTCHGQRITWLHESAVLFWLNNESTFFGIKFGTSPKPVCFFFSLEVSHSENHRRPFQDQCIYPPLDSCQSMYHNMILPWNSKTSLNSRHYSNQKNQPLLGSIGHPKPSIYNYQHQVVKPQVHSDLVQVLPAPNRTIRSGSHGQWLRIDTTCLNRVYLIMVIVVKTESLP